MNADAILYRLEDGCDQPSRAEKTGRAQRGKVGGSWGENEWMN